MFKYDKHKIISLHLYIPAHSSTHNTHPALCLEVATNPVTLFKTARAIVAAIHCIHASIYLSRKPYLFAL